MDRSYIFFVSVKILKILEESEFLMLNFIYGKSILFALNSYCKMTPDCDNYGQSL